MPTAQELRQLMVESEDDPFMEARVMKAMLETMLYVHQPREQKDGVLRFCQFDHPDNGMRVLPFFSDRTKAVEAAAGRVLVVPILGRNLFTYTLGATLMLDPNERDCVFYPEEIRALLAGESTGVAQLWQSDAPARLTSAEGVPSAFIESLERACQNLPSVTAAYIAFAEWKDGRADLPALLVAIVTNEGEREHVVRAVSTAIQPHVNNLDRTIDLTLISADTVDYAMMTTGRLVYARNITNV